MKNLFKGLWQRTIRPAELYGNLVKMLSAANADAVLSSEHTNTPAYVAVELSKRGFNNVGTIEERREYLNQVKAMVRYAKRYPKGVFVPDPLMKQFLKKHELVIIPARDYTGDIPQHGQLEISNFKLADTEIMVRLKPVDAHDKYKGLIERDFGKGLAGALGAAVCHGIYAIATMLDSKRITKAEYEANPQQWQEQGYVLKNEIPMSFHIVTPAISLGIIIDPGEVIVSHNPVYVFCEVPDGYLLVTRWDDEITTYL